MYTVWLGLFALLLGVIGRLYAMIIITKTRLFIFIENFTSNN